MYDIFAICKFHAYLMPIEILCQPHTNLLVVDNPSQVEKDNRSETEPETNSDDEHVLASKGENNSSKHHVPVGIRLAVFIM